MKFEFADKAPLVVVEAKLNNKGPFNFVVDTGSSATVVGREAAEALGIRQDPNTPTGGCCSSKTVAVGLLQMDGMSRRKVPIVLGNLSRLSEETGTRLDGIIGSPFMQDYEVVIDYPHKEVIFEEPRERKQVLATRFRLVRNAKFIVVETELNGKGPFDFLVDTGATRTVVAKHIGQSLGLHEVKVKKKALSGFFAGATMSISKIESVQVGPAKSTDVEVGVQDLQRLSSGLGIPVDGALGYTFMRDYRVTINYPEQTLSFEREKMSEVGGITGEVK